MKRREFIAGSIAAGVAAPLIGQEYAMGDMPRRPYGKEGLTLPMVGFGGIIVMDETPSDAAKCVAAAVERGVNYFDVAPTYGDAEEKLGPALEPYRDECFLACKTEMRDAVEGQAALENSLKLLRTDHFDLYQLHGLSSVDEVDTAFGPGGVMETVTKAKQDGLVRYLGFSAHSDEAAVKAMELFDFDSILFPLNCVSMTKGGFGHAALAKAQEKAMSILALKGMAWGPWEATAQDRSDSPKAWYQPISDPELARLALSYTLDLPVSSIIPPGNWESFSLACDIAEKYSPLTDDEKAKLEARMDYAAPLFRTQPG